MSRSVEPGLSSRLLAQASDCPSDVAVLTLARLSFACPFDSGIEKDPNRKAVRTGESLASQTDSTRELFGTQLMTFDGARWIHVFLRLRIEPHPIGAALSMTSAPTSGGKLDHLGMSEKIQTAETLSRIEFDPAANKNNGHRRGSFFKNFVMLQRKCGRWVSFSNTPP